MDECGGVGQKRNMTSLFKCHRNKGGHSMNKMSRGRGWGGKVRKRDREREEWDIGEMERE